MPLPLFRAIEITSNASNLLTKYTCELAQGADEKRVSEIIRDAKLIKLIVKAALYPHRKELRPFIEGNDELLEDLGFK